jgi:hypothetical protein
VDFSPLLPRFVCGYFHWKLRENKIAGVVGITKFPLQSAHTEDLHIQEMEKLTK